jgi:hypothetical protein
MRAVPRTEEDLRRVLHQSVTDESIERLAGFVRALDGDDDEVLTTGWRPTRSARALGPHRWIWPGAVAASVLVLALAAGLVIALRPSGHPATAGGAPTRPSVAVTPQSSAVETWSQSQPVSDGAGDSTVVSGRIVATGVSFQWGRMVMWMGAQPNGGLAPYVGTTVEGQPVTRYSMIGSAGDSTDGYQCGAPGAKANGFHCGLYASGTPEDGRAYLAFGYVVGNVSTVTLTVGGVARAASTAVWSDDPAVHFYWVAGPRTTHYTAGWGAVTTMIARDASGHVIARVNGKMSYEVPAAMSTRSG